MLAPLPPINLTLHISQDAPDHLLATLVGTTTVGPCPAVFDAAALAAFTARLRSGRRLAPAEQRRWGEQLGDVLLPPGPIRTAWQAAWADAVTNAGGLRLRLVCADAALESLPWEYSHVPLVKDGTPQPLSYDPRFSLVRLGRSADDVVLNATDDALPLEVLVVLAGPPDQPPLQLDKEATLIEASLQQLPPEALHAPTVLRHTQWPQLVAALAGARRADVVHFAGHGYYRDDEAGLIFHDDEDPNASREIPAGELAQRLRGKQVKVLVIGACESARVDAELSSGVAQTLLAAGVAAVVAMQFVVDDREAAAFSSGFYTAIATGATVDVAVTEGRLRMAATVPDTTGWGCPVVYMRTTEARLVNVQASLPPAVEALRDTLLVSQAVGLLRGQLTGIDAGTLRLSDGRLTVNQQIETVEATGTVVGLRVGTLAGGDAPPPDALSTPTQTAPLAPSTTAVNGNGASEVYSPLPSFPPISAVTLTQTAPLAPSTTAVNGNGASEVNSPTLPYPPIPADTPAGRPADPVAAAGLEPTEATTPPSATSHMDSATAAHPALTQHLPTTSPAIRAVFEDAARNFVGRARARAAIDSFRTNGNRSLLIVGPPGSGKTALAARLVVEHAATATPWVYAFCGVDDGDSPTAFIDTLYRQLGTQLGPAFTATAQQLTAAGNLSLEANIVVGTNSGTVTGVQIEQLTLGEVQPREDFRRRIREPLRSYRRATDAAGTPQPLTIIVDAVDRAWAWDGGQTGNIVTLLSEAQDLPVWVNVICTARPGAAVQQLRGRGGAQVFDLAEHADDNVRDIATFLEQQFTLAFAPAAQQALEAVLHTTPPYAALATTERMAALVARVGAATEGSFLWARRYADTLQTALLRPTIDATINPAGLLAEPQQLDAALSEIYAEQLHTVRRNLPAGDTLAEQVLAVLAAAYVPLPPALLATLVGVELHACTEATTRLDAVLAPLRPPQVAVALYSRSFAEYLRQTLADNGRQWDRMIAERLDAAGDRGDPRAQEYRARFGWKHLQRGLHLAAPGSGAAPPLAVLVPDPLLRARVLRAQAVTLLDPSSMRPDAWRTALALLGEAYTAVQRCRALAPYRRRDGIRLDQRQLLPTALAAVGELERTLVARGDAQVVIASQLLGTDEQRTLPAGGLARTVILMWGLLQRLPLLFWALPLLLRTGVAIGDLVASLPTIGRGLDWSVARTLLRALHDYTHAATFAVRRGDAASLEEIVDRQAQVYARLGAWQSAARSFNSLLAGPDTVGRPWQEALWRLRLGEVRAAQETPVAAAPLLEAALRHFVAQDAPIPLARVCNVLTRVHLEQAAQAHALHDFAAAGALHDRALRRAEDGVFAWGRLNQLQGDELAQIDPALGQSQLAGSLWQMRRNEGLSDEAHARATQLLARIPERHFSQRFDHPWLRSFRVAMLLLVPLLLLGGLVFAIQFPSTLTLVPQAAAVFRPPLVDVQGFPDNLLGNGDGGRAEVFVQTINSVNATAAVQAGQPRFDARNIVDSIALALTTAALGYVLLGVGFIAVAEASDFQHRRPGRLVVTPDALLQRRMPQPNDRWWMWRSLLQRLWRGVYRRTVPPDAMPPVNPVVASTPEQSLPWNTITSVITVERTLARRRVYDLCEQIVAAPDNQRVRIDGAVARYDELVDEIAQRVRERAAPPAQWQLTTELLRGPLGCMFVVGLVLAWLLIGGAVIRPELLRRPLGTTGLRPSELYVALLPMLIIPVVYWGMYQPLLLQVVRKRHWWPAAVACAGGMLASLLSALRWDAALLSITPDLVLPWVAMGLLISAPVLLHRTQKFYPRRGGMVRGRWFVVILGAASLIGWNGWHGLNEWRWYTASVRGGRAVERAAATPACVGQPCAILDQAAAQYDHMIALRPDLADGYAYRGITALLAGDPQRATAFFDQVLQLPSLPGGNAAQVNTAAGIAAVHAARSATLPADAANAFNVALARYVAAWELPQRVPDPATLGRYAACRADPEPDVFDLTAIPAAQRKVALAAADLWYTRAMRQLTTLRQDSTANFYTVASRRDGADCRAVRAWHDLSQAIFVYDLLSQALRTNEPLYADVTVGLATAWLARGEFPVALRPADVPGEQTALQRASDAYAAALGAAAVPNPEIMGGAAWTALRQDAPDDALRLLAAAQALAPTDPRFPALAGLAWWLHSDSFVNANGSLLPGYHRTLNHAVEEYTAALERAADQGDDIGPYYATRSVLLFKLRNTTTAPPAASAAADVPPTDAIAALRFADAALLPAPTPDDYGIWMKRAINDMDNALDAALNAPDSAQSSRAYRYWRGRLHVSLALTWQVRRAGLHTWREIAPHYAAAFDDFSVALAAEPDDQRRQQYQLSWLTPTRLLMRNANHLALVEESINLGLANGASGKSDYRRAAAELALVITNDAPIKSFDSRAIPQADYGLMSGFVALALGEATGNTLLGEGTFAAMLHYERAIRDYERTSTTGTGIFVPTSLRPQLFTAAICQLDTLAANPPAGWSAAARRDAPLIRATLVAHGGSRAGCTAD